MPVIRLPERGSAIPYVPGPSLLDILAEAGVMPPSPCGAAGICGKCAVTVTGGEVPLPTEQEARLFSEGDLARGRRLACGLYPETDLDLDLPREDREGVVLADGYLPDFRLEPSLFKKTVPLDPDPAYHPRMVQLEVFPSAGPVAPDDRCRNSRPENVRAFQNNESYFALRA